jgi:hypothetical protein
MTYKRKIVQEESLQRAARIALGRNKIFSQWRLHTLSFFTREKTNIYTPRVSVLLGKKENIFLLWRYLVSLLYRHEL